MNRTKPYFEFMSVDVYIFWNGVCVYSTVNSSKTKHPKRVYTENLIRRVFASRASFCKQFSKCKVFVIFVLLLILSFFSIYAFVMCMFDSLSKSRQTFARSGVSNHNNKLFISTCKFIITISETSMHRRVSLNLNILASSEIEMFLNVENFTLSSLCASCFYGFLQALIRRITCALSF